MPFFTQKKVNFDVFEEYVKFLIYSIFFLKKKVLQD